MNPVVSSRNSAMLAKGFGLKSAMLVVGATALAGIFLIIGIKSTHVASPAVAARNKSATAKLTRFDIDAMVQKGQDLFNQGQYEGAIAQMDEVIRLRPNRAGAYILRGDAYKHVEKVELALADYERAIELQPKRIEKWLERSYGYYDQKDYDAAIRECDESLKLDPELWQANRIRGQSLFYRSNYVEALKDFDQVVEAVELEPDQLEYLLGAYDFRAEIYKKNGDREKELENRRLAASKAPDNARIQYRLGDLLLYLGRYEESIAPLTRVIELDPANSSAWVFRARSEIQLNRKEAAIADFSAYLPMQPQNVHAFYERGALYLQTGKLDLALADADEAVRLSRDPSYFYQPFRDQILALKSQSQSQTNSPKAKP